MIRLRSELAADLGGADRDAVLTALQQALRLEHSTIPPYLYALYSVVPGTNAAVADIIESVVVEEMLHMALVSNIILGLDGSPVLDRPDAIPRYPATLPGSVAGGLVVGLAPCSLDVIEDVFMKIEEPEDPLVFPAELAADEVTIGEFYAAITTSITALGDAAFVGDRNRQLGPDVLPYATVVTDVASARAAIETIVAQGEGTTTAPLEVAGTDVAHYYRFNEIVHGHRLIPNPEATSEDPPDRRYLYAGEPIPFDGGNISPLPVNPTLRGYPAGSSAFFACRTFNYTYTGLLRVLHEVFNGVPDRYEAAIGLMMSLEQQAKDLTTGVSTGGAVVGPSFEYQPING
jgi:Ferritin-like